MPKGHYDRSISPEQRRLQKEAEKAKARAAKEAQKSSGTTSERKKPGPKPGWKKVAASSSQTPVLAKKKPGPKPGWKKFTAQARPAAVPASAISAMEKMGILSSHVSTLLLVREKLGSSKAIDEAIQSTLGRMDTLAETIQHNDRQPTMIRVTPTSTTVNPSPFNPPSVEQAKVVTE